MSRDALTIVHATDFSRASELAFVHALRLAVAFRGRLFLLHVHDAPGGAAFDHFPPVRATLARWGLLPADAPQSAVPDVLGVDVAKVDVRAGDPRLAISDFAQRHGASLLVLATHGRDGLGRLFLGSVAEGVANHTHRPTLFVPQGARGFVEPETGRLRLSRVLAPVDVKPDPLPALRALDAMLTTLGVGTDALRALHVGDDAPALHINERAEAVPVTLARGPVVDTILAHAADADLMVMPTEGRNGLFDALRGSTTERVTRHAPCPVLAIPSRR